QREPVIAAVAALLQSADFRFGRQARARPGVRPRGPGAAEERPGGRAFQGLAQTDFDGIGGLHGAKILCGGYAEAPRAAAEEDAGASCGGTPCAPVSSSISRSWRATSASSGSAASGGAASARGAQANNSRQTASSFSFQ